MQTLCPTHTQAEQGASGHLDYCCFDRAAYRKMVCGVHLGILLICLVQAEHVRCLWATEAQSSQRQNNAYVGFSQQQSGQGRLASNYPQNQLRLASTQRSSFNTEPAASSSRSSQVYSSRGDASPRSQPAQSGHSSVRLVQSSSLSRLNWPPAKSNHASAQTVPKKQSLGLSTSIASGSSVSKYNKKENVSKKRTWPVQQGTAHVNKYVSSSSASVPSPRSLSAARKAPSAAATSTSYGPRSYAPVKSSSQFSVGAPALQERPVQMQTSATARARRVSSHGPKPSRFALPQKQNVNFQPRSYTSTNLRTETSDERFAPTRTYNIPDRFGGFAIRRLKEPADQKVSVRKPQPSYPASKPQQQSYPASSWQSASLKPQQQAYPAPPQQYPAPPQQYPAPPQQYPAPPQQYPAPPQQYPAPPQQYPAPPQQYPAPPQQYPAPPQQYPAPPQQYPAPPQQYPAPPQQYPAPLQQQVQSVHHESKWKRVRPSGNLGAAGITG